MRNSSSRFRVLMISRSAYQWDARVKKEARALVAAGHSVKFIGLPSEQTRDGDIELVHVPAQSPSGHWRRRQSVWFRAIRWLLLPEHRLRAEHRFRKLAPALFQSLDWTPDVVHAHDYPSLPVAVKIAEGTGAKLVYDSHEVWAGRPRHGRPEPLRRLIQRRDEARLVRKADAVLMVSPAGATLLKSTLGLDRVHVIRNTFPVRDDIHPPRQPIGAMYAGRIAPHRDLETLFRSDIWGKSDLRLHLMGDIHDIEVPDWVAVHPKGTMDEVERRLAQVGIGLVAMTNQIVNHRIALPNKLFQSIAVGVPVVAADAPQTAAVVREHHLGELYTPGHPSSFSKAVSRVVANYPELVENVRRAQPLFDWSLDAANLVEIYGSLENRQRHPSI